MNRGVFVYKIMIVEDDNALSQNICERLKKWGYDASTVKNFEDMIPEFAEFKPKLVIMDVNLPFYDGFYWCKKIRDISKIPVLFLSSRDTDMDIVMAVNTGADDYITKPFSMDVLIAKINALLRRTYSYAGENDDTFEHNNVVLNMSDGTLLYGENKIELTKNEFKVIMLLMKNSGRVVSRERIMRALWDDDNFINDNTLTVNINRLRGKLGDIGLDSLITTKKGYGYMIL